MRKVARTGDRGETRICRRKCTRANRARESAERLDSFIEKLGEAGKDKANAMAELAAVKDATTALEAQLESEKKNSNRARLGLVAKSGGEDAGVAAALTADLEKREATIASLKKDIEAYRSISEANEEALRAVSEDSKKLKLLHEKKVAQLSSQIDALKMRLQRSEASLREANETAKQLAAERKAAEKTAAEANDAENFSRIAKEANEKYQAELESHAADISKLTELASRAEAKEKELSSLRAKCARQDAVADQLKKSFDEREGILKQRVADLKAQIVDTNRHTVLMDDQVERLRRELARSRDDAMVTDEDGEESADANLNRLQELHQIAVRQKERATVAREDAEFRLSRATQKIEALNKSLDRARAELQREVTSGDIKLTEAEHRKLLAASQENIVLRNMNAHITAQYEKSQADDKSRAEELKKVKATARKIKAQAGKWESEVGALKSSGESLKKECDLYRERYEKIVKSFEGKVDPEEHSRAVAEATERAEKAEEKMAKFKNIAIKKQKELKALKESAARRPKMRTKRPRL